MLLAGLPLDSIGSISEASSGTTGANEVSAELKYGCVDREQRVAALGF